MVINVNRATKVANEIFNEIEWLVNLVVEKLRPVSVSGDPLNALAVCIATVAEGDLEILLQEEAGIFTIPSSPFVQSASAMVHALADAADRQQPVFSTFQVRDLDSEPKILGGGIFLSIGGRTFYIAGSGFPEGLSQGIVLMAAYRATLAFNEKSYSQRFVKLAGKWEGGWYKSLEDATLAR